MSIHPDLQGKVALVTGSGRGLGFAMADRLAQLGAHIAVHDMSWEAPARFGEFENLGASAAKIAEHGVRTTTVTGNIGDPGFVRQMAAKVEAELGAIDILVNCAGGDVGVTGGKPNPNTALGTSYEDIQLLVNNNLIGLMMVCQAVCPGMVERGAGSVINIASVAAHFGTSPEVVYSTLKAAVVHYTRCLAFELRPSGVRVNGVSPGPTKTARFVNSRKVDPAMMDAGKSLIRYGDPAEIADVVAFLAGSGSRFIHGQIIRVDGGMSLYAG
jgi:3-oxoacyl-[acyl-carrier protein] reductase